MAINFISSKVTDEAHVLHSKSDNIELFESILSRYQTWLETSMRGIVLSLIVFIYCITNIIK